MDESDPSGFRHGAGMPALSRHEHGADFHGMPLDGRPCRSVRERSVHSGNVETALPLFRRGPRRIRRILFSCRGEAAQHLQPVVQVALMRQQHRLGPGDARIGVEPVDDERLAVLPERTGIEAQPLEDGHKLPAALGHGQQIDLLHALGCGAQLFVRFHRLHEDGALVDFRYFPENGREHVPLGRGGMHPQFLMGIHQRFLADALQELEALTVEAHLPRARPLAESLRDAVDQMESRIRQHLEKFFHARLTSRYDTGRTAPS